MASILIKDTTREQREQIAVADSKVRPFTASRACLDFKI